MGVPSEFIRQHIGTIEYWIEQNMQSGWVNTLKIAGCDIKDAVEATDIKSGIKFTPNGIEGDFKRRWEEEDIERLVGIFRFYLSHLSDLDHRMVQHAVEIDKRRDELEETLIRESIEPGKRLWFRNQFGVWNIEFTKIEDGYAEYLILNKETVTTERSKLSYMRLFTKYEDACNKDKEGCYVRTKK